MSTLSKRSAVYFDPEIYKAIRVKAASSDLSISEIIDDAVRVQLAEDQEDFLAFDERASESEISYGVLLKDLKTHGQK